MGIGTGIGVRRGDGEWRYAPMYERAVQYQQVSAGDREDYMEEYVEGLSL